MMSKRQWFVLLCLFIIYLLLGASLFYFIESEEERKTNIRDKQEKKVIEELLIKHYKSNNDSQATIFEKLTNYCGKPLNLDMSQIDNPQKWNFYHSFFFVITAVSTIGYGNLAPTTMFTRIFLIFYCLIGIPINGIVMVTLGDFFGKSFTKLYDRWKKSEVKYETAKLGLIGQIILYLVPGFTFFIFLPSVFTMMFEGWSYDVAVYNAFVTLTTIGFGDYVAGVTDVFSVGPVVYTIYQIFLLVWIIGGLGYIIMVLGFITRGLQSKKMVQLEKVIAENIKKTPTKIRKELRALINELLFMPVKPVYKKEFEEYIPNRLESSVSCPDLTIYRNMDSPTMARKRALSDCYRYMVLQRAQSDSDLQMIDVDATFQQSESTQNLFFNKICDALSLTSDTEERGIHGFSDHEILASERVNSNWSLSPPVPQKKNKRRAFSDIRPPVLFSSKYQDPAETFREIKTRNRTFSEPTDALIQQSQTLIQKLKNAFKPKEEKSFDVEKQMQGGDLHNARHKRASVFSTGEEHYLKQTLRGRLSVLSAKQESLLEQVSAAEFLRSMRTLADEATETHSRAISGLSSGVESSATTPQRARRMPIRPVMNTQLRRSSLMPPTAFKKPDSRRLSLRPVEEHLLRPDPPPYSATSASTTRRKYSAHQGPVQRHLSRREKD